MSHGVESFVVKRSNIPPSASTRRQIAASLKVKQTPTLHHQTPQRNQTSDSNHHANSYGLGIGQKHIVQVKDEQADSQHGIPGETHDGYGADGRHGYRENTHERDVKTDAHGDVFDTDVGEDFDRSISDVQAPRSQSGFRGQRVALQQDGLRVQSDESVLEDDEDNSRSEDDDEDESYARDPDHTIRINEDFQTEQAAFNVALRAKPERHTRFQPYRQHTGGNPRSKLLEELGSYPITTVSSPENVQETDITGNGLGGQTMPQRQDTTRTQAQLSGDPGSYYSSSDEGEERGMIRNSQTPGVMTIRTTPGIGAKERRYEEQLDYPPNAIAAMTYNQLQTQSFDTDPNAGPLILPPDLSSAPLSDQLAHISILPEDQKRQFFSTLSLDSWEDCGDWFTDRFSGIVKKMTELRREKRKVATAFEAEIANRQERVRLKTEHLRTAMSRMQREGKVLLEEKIA